MKYPDTYVVWDLETTGLDAFNDKIIEIGAVKVVEGKTVDTKYWLLDHGIFLSEKTTEITGITDELIDKEAMDPTKALKEFIGFFKEIKSWANVSHNGYRFDMGFLKNALPEEVREKIHGNMIRNMVDTAVLVKGKKLGMRRGLDESFASYAERVMNIRAFGVKYNIPLCCEELEIDTSTATFHRAAGDATLTNEIYKKVKEPSYHASTN